ncbi:MAG: metal-dependent transcriptional regulator [Thermodesulfobacteriota bacterium]
MKPDDDSTLSENLEDYLETILALESENKVARVKDIAEKLGVLRGSVSGALKTLAEKGLVNHEPYSFITLTEEGRKLATEIRRRHDVIKGFLSEVLQLDAETAEANACRMEHAMDKPSVDRLVKFIEYIKQCPRTGTDWFEGFVDYYSKNRMDRKQCRNCLEACLDRQDNEGDRS